MTENIEELSLFRFEEFRDPTYHVRDLTLIQNELPDLEWITETPPYDTWHDDGVPFMAQDWSDVLTSMLDDADTITPRVAEQAFDQFMSNGQFGRANTFAYSVCQLNLADEEHWSNYELLSGLAYIRSGLAEATLLPFSTIDEETGEVVHKSHMEPKHFLGIYNMAMALAEEHPEELAPYLEYADGLHVEMLLRYPYLSDYTSVMWNFWGSDPDDPRKQSIYERVGSRDNTWREQAADTLSGHIQALMCHSGFFRAGVLANFGRATGLVTAEFIKGQFLKTYDTLDLSTELVDHIAATNSVIVPHEFPRLTDLIIVPHEFPRLTDLKVMVSELWQNDLELQSDLEAVMARREIETIQTILSKPKDVDPGMAAMLKDEMATLARDLPDTDSQKKPLLSVDTSEKFEAAIQDMARAGALKIDRLIERHFMNLADGIVDLDTLSIDIDRLEAAVIADVSSSDIASDAFERLIGYIPPLCRLGQDIVDQYISDDFIRTAKDVIDASMEHYASDIQDTEYFKQMRSSLDKGPMGLFSFYWAHHEEYYS